ncbi:MAG: carbohydrate ABC transporter permease [Chloroflexi bacterium]|nr:carbohydrate ABC transporter permease [Chloroflexota bacterium]
MNTPLIPVLLASHLFAAVLGFAGTRHLFASYNRSPGRGSILGAVIGLLGGLIALYVFWLAFLRWVFFIKARGGNIHTVTASVLKYMSGRHFRMNLIAMFFLATISVVWIYPFIWVVLAAFKTQPELFTLDARMLPEGWEWARPRDWRWENFRNAWIKADFRSYFGNTVYYATIATMIEVIKSSMCGYVLARYRFPGRNVLYKLILATLFIPVASIIIPQFVLVKELGLLNTRFGVVLALSGGAGALYVLLFTGFFSTIPEDIFDSARIDGANFFQTFRLVLPLARPVIGTVVIFQFMRTWNEFNIPLVFTFSKPELRNMAVGMYAFRGEHSSDWIGFAAGTVISVVPVLLVFFLFQGFFVRGLAGAVKE